MLYLKGNFLKHQNATLNNFVKFNNLLLMRAILLLIFFQLFFLVTSIQYAFASPSLCDATAGNLIRNCGFETGAVASSSLGFTSSYAYQRNLQPEGTYYIGSDAATYHGGWIGSPHSGSDALFVNGSSKSNVVAWSENAITVVPETLYYFSVFAESASPADKTYPSVLSFSVNGLKLGTAFVASTTQGVWEQFYATWYSGNVTSVLLSLVDSSTAANGNDFALDDVIFATTAPTGGTSVGGTNVPEPSTILLLLGSLTALACLRRGKLFSMMAMKRSNLRSASRD